MQKGFTLIEILIVLTIIGIIVSLTEPVYEQHFVTAKRFEAKMALSRLAIAMQKYFLLNNTYENATLKKLNMEEYIAKRNYRLTIVAHTTDYELHATPIGKQAKKDNACGTLIYHSVGEWSHTGSNKMENC